MNRLLLIALCLAACSGGNGDRDADPNAPDADPNAPDARPGAIDAAPGAPDAELPAPISACYLACDTVADCDHGNAINDPDNFDCDGGRCIWHGCNSTPECQEAFSSTDYVCGTLPGAPFPMCYLACDTVADCVTASVLYDADNYACTGGKCEWQGCNSTPECQDALSSPDYVCAAAEGALYPSCQYACSTVADCDLGSSLYDADNYECNGTFCVWQGCNSTAECIDSLMSSDYICD